MHPLLEQIFISRSFINSKNETIEVHSETSKEQCAFLQQLIVEKKYTRSIEIGLAYGVSSLAIIEAVVQNGGRHMAIDQFQQEVWGDNGLELLKLSGLNNHFNFLQQFSYQALPVLLAKGEQFDFAYIDSTKQMDWLMVDFFYLDRLLAINGMIVFDDVTWPGIRKLLRYLSRFPSYKVYATLPENKPAEKPRTFLKWLLKNEKTRKLLKQEYQQTDFSLGVNSHCVALYKVDDDKRNWDWHVDF